MTSATKYPQIQQHFIVTIFSTDMNFKIDIKSYRNNDLTLFFLDLNFPDLANGQPLAVSPSHRNTVKFFAITIENISQ